MRSIEEITDDIVGCADEIDGGRVDAREFVSELIAVVRAISPLSQDKCTRCHDTGCYMSFEEGDVAVSNKCDHGQTRRSISICICG